MEGENIPSYIFMLIKRGPLSQYCYIKNLSRLLYSQQDSEGNHYHYCVRCLQGFSTQAVFAKHRTLCRGASFRPTRIEMPEKGKNTLQFQNYQRQMKAPYVIYADCDSSIEKYGTCFPSTDKSSTTKTEIHQACGFSFIAVRSDGSVTKTYNYRGENCVRQFFSALLQTETEITESLKQKAPLNMSEEDWKAFHRAKECHICKKDLFRYNAKDEIEFWHPDTGEYCGKVHKSTRAPGRESSCYSEILKIETQDENGKYIIKQ